MSIYIEFQLDAGTLDGITPYVFAADDWTNRGRFRFTAQLPNGDRLGVIDWNDLILSLEATFGPFLDKAAPHVGATSYLTDWVIERTLVNTPGAGVVPEVGTHTLDFGNPSGLRARATPEMLPTESVDVFQGGGTGQVATTLVANGQSGIVVVPTAMRSYVLSAAIAGDHTYAVWLFPVSQPRDLSLAVSAGQPPAQFA